MIENEHAPWRRYGPPAGSRPPVIDTLDFVVIVEIRTLLRCVNETRSHLSREIAAGSGGHCGSTPVWGSCAPVVRGTFRRRIEGRRFAAFPWWHEIVELWPRRRESFGRVLVQGHDGFPGPLGAGVSD